MKAFTIDAESNITVFPSRAAAETNLPPTGAFVFTTASGLDSYLKKFPATAAVEIWNSLTGATPVTKFKDRPTAVSRIWKAIQVLGEDESAAPLRMEVPTPLTEVATTTIEEQVPDAPETAQPEAPAPETTDDAPATPATDVAPQTPDAAPEATPAKTKVGKAKRAPKAATESGTPREGSKTSQVIAMLKREGGTTLEEIMAEMQWLKHTTRAMLSAGGSLTKKHGLVVTSQKVGETRKYCIKG